MSAPGDTMESKSTTSVVAAFQDWMEDLESEQELKETIRVKVRDLEASGRELAAILQKVHHASGFSDLPGVVKESEAFFEAKIRDLFGQLAGVVPVGEDFFTWYRSNTVLEG